MQGAEVDAANNLGKTPLIAACWRSHEKVAEALLEAGAKVHGVSLFSLHVNPLSDFRMQSMASRCCTGTLPNIRNTLNKKSTSHSGPRIAANSVE